VTTPTVLVPLDATEPALVALPIAKRLAEVSGATLHLLHVAEQMAPPDEVLERIGLRGAELRGSVLGTRVGEPASGIIDTAGELGSALVVMCTHTASDKALGSTALAVLQGAPCPVVLVPPERGVVPWALRRILLPHDGTPTTSAAISPAADLARRAGAELDVLHVAVPAAAPPVEVGSLSTPRYLDQPQHEWPAWAAEFVERLACACPLESIRVRLSLAHGAPGEEALRACGEHASDLIVLAWRGVWEGEHAATVKSVVHHAACPVMVIRVPG
jgi:nucleotide-binding universal stress UspA family protein